MHEGDIYCDCDSHGHCARPGIVRALYNRENRTYMPTIKMTICLLPMPNLLLSIIILKTL